MKTRLVSSMERVFPEEKLEAREWKRGEAFLGERLNFQLAYFWEEGPAWATVEVETALSGVTLRKVELEPVEYAAPVKKDKNFLRTQAGLYPDILAPLDGSLRLQPGQWRALWISLDTQEEAPGEYPVVIRILSEGKLVGKETFLFTLLPARLPAQRLLYTQWLHTDCIHQWYKVEVFSEAWWELVEKFVCFGSEHGINTLLTPLFTPPLDTLEGTERPTVQLVDVTVAGQGYQFGFEKLERWLEMCRRCHIRCLEGSHLFTQWGAGHAPKIIAEKNGKKEQIFGWDTEAAGEAYTGFLESFLPALTAFLDRHDMQGKFFFHISDEPSAKHLEHYGKLSKLVHTLIADYPVMDALSDYAFYREGFVDMPVCATEHIAPYLKNRTPNLWAYYCGCHVKGVSNRLLAMPGARNRCIGLQLYDADVEGFLHWGYNFWLTQYATKTIDPYRVSDAGGSFASGDSFSVYPGEKGPVAAVSLELFLEALQDYRALCLAESLGGRREVEKLYADNPYRSFSTCPRESSAVLEQRKKINAWICSKLSARRNG